MQSKPPFAGAGLVQFLVWVWMPFPQVTVHVLQSDQFVQFPSVLEKSRFLKENKSISFPIQYSIILIKVRFRKLNNSLLTKSQGPESQTWVSVSIFVSLQFKPPSGIIQVLVLVWFPSPQIESQESHSDQSDHVPSDKII